MARRHFSEEELAATRAAWEAKMAPVRAVLTQQAALYERVREHLQPFWEHLTAGKTLTRKPSFGLRLLAADTQILVALSPHYTYRPPAVHPAHLVLDVILEVERYVSTTDPTPVYQLKPSLRLRVKPDGAYPQLLSSTCTSGTLDALATLCEQFLTDPTDVLRRSTRHCCICGRALTDGQSQARGIGPECLKHLSPLLAFQQSIFGWMETMADLEEEKIHAQ